MSINSFSLNALPAPKIGHSRLKNQLTAQPEVYCGENFGPFDADSPDR
jgi:hypothetical protein